MLFYKRVELEEENGKDFNFDVSPDLLEVPGWLQSHSTLLSHFLYSLKTLKYLFCISFIFSTQWIWQDNMQFLQDKNIFEHTYFG